MEITPSARRRTGPRDTDGMAVAAFVLGLLGLPFLNLVLGPFAFVLALLARHRRTTRRLPALAGMILGIADVAVYAALATADNTVVLSLA
ncbi:DUF4190 domain-containing protein [Streptomyces sp. JJ66]|nr:DUF4190 domain-containing protein [Streptomyces sp. JJ66]MBW1604522.1 DUF4190 domain-containing protein [Streptomyces sp. JJ66]